MKAVRGGRWGLDPRAALDLAFTTEGALTGAPPSLLAGASIPGIARKLEPLRYKGVRAPHIVRPAGDVRLRSACPSMFFALHVLPCIKGIIG